MTIAQLQHEATEQLTEIVSKLTEVFNCYEIALSNEDQEHLAKAIESLKRITNPNQFL